MCLEDLRLGRGRFPGVSSFNTTAGVPAILLKPDARRVAILVTFSGQAQEALATGSIQNDQCFISFGPNPQVSPAIILSTTSPVLLLRIEDYGQLVMGELHISFTDSTALGVNMVCAQPIISNVITTPIPESV